MTIASALPEVLERARAAGFLGPGPVELHLRHAEGFAVAAEDMLGREPPNFADLGTGGGIPGLVLAARWAASTGVLVEVGRRRAAFLREVIDDLGLAGRIELLEERGEAVGRLAAYREQFAVVTARSFAAPAITAEIAAGLVRPTGVLVVSDPPQPDDGRWQPDGLAPLGFGPADLVEVGEGHFAVVRKERPAPTRYPRGVGRPGKRPLW